MTQARGIRNNNPLNIRKGSNWKGLSPIQSDKEFCVFRSRAFGLRAAIKLIRNYIVKTDKNGQAFNTIYKIISRWAPPSENITEDYIKAVCTKMGISEHTPIKQNDRNTICRLVQAMGIQESGIIIPFDEILSAYDLL